MSDATTATPPLPGPPSTVAMLGFVVGGVGLMLEPVNWTLFWVGVVLAVVALPVFAVMAKMGIDDS